MTGAEWAETALVTALVIVAGWILETLRRAGRTKHNGR